MNSVVARPALSKLLQVKVFQRDGWMCRWCGRPVIFAPVMRYLDLFVRQHGFSGPLAYHDARWRRDKAPLLDHMGAVIDHIQAHSRGGAAHEDNFATSCNKCNTRKSSAHADDFSRRSPLHRVKGKYGEPESWDGLSQLFIVLAGQNSRVSNASEREWLKALTTQFRETDKRI